MKKTTKDKDKKIVIDKKIGKALKDVVPPGNKPPRDMIPIVNNQPISKDYISEYVPFEILPEWPGDEAAKVGNTIKYYKII